MIKPHMIKKVIVLTAIFTFTTQNALAETQAVSAGYAHSNINNTSINLDGINLRYSYEWDLPLGMMGTFTWMQGHKSTTDDTGSRYNLKGKYYSLMAGPVYRISEPVSVYASLGVANTDVKLKSKADNVILSSYSTSLAWGAGIIINSTDNFNLTVGYEGSRAHIYDDHYSITGFNAGIGFRF